MQRFIAEIKRRRIIPVAAYYVVGTWLILQVADVLLPAWGVPDRAIQFIVYAALLGFPIALTFGWRYNLGPDGVSRTLPLSPDDQTGAATELARRDYLLLTLMSLAMVAISGWTLQQLLNDEPVLPVGAPNSVAVLAFEDASDSGATIATDLADKLVTSLIAINKLKVTGRESSFYFTGRSIPLKQISRMLNVRHLLTGHVSGSEDQLNIAVQLIKMPEETAIWAQTFKTTANSAYEVLAPIGDQVAAALRVHVTEVDRKHTDARPAGSPKALGLIRLSRQAGNSGHYGRSIKLIEQALELDPTIAKAHVWRALIYLLNFSEFGKPAIDIVRQVAQQSLDKAHALGADDAEYYFTRGLQARRETWMGSTPAWQKAVEENFDRAITLNPSDAQAYVSYSIYFRRLRRYTDASRLLETALDFDPLHPGAILQYSRSLSALGRREEALEYALRLPELYEYQQREVAFRYFEYEQLDKAIEWLLKAASEDPRNSRDIAEILAILRAPQLAITWLEKITDDKVFGPLAASQIKAIAGDYEVAYQRLTASIGLNQGDKKQGQTLPYSAVKFALLAGHAKQAIAFTERLFPELSDPLAPRVNEQNVHAALRLAIALAAQDGNPVRVGILSGMILNTTRERPILGFDGVGLRAARVYALQGDTSQAVTAFQAAYDQGLRTIYTPEGKLSPPLEKLIGNPQFDRLVNKINADLASMLMQARIVVSASPGLKN